MDRKQACLDGAIKLGEKLLATVKHDENGPYWECLSQTSDLQPVWGISHSFYSGNPGIAIFLLELGKATGDNRFTDIALQNMDWTHKFSQANEMRALSYLTGSISAARGMLHAAAVTGDDSWKQKALDLLAVYREEDCVGPVETDDMLNGKAGALLGLMYIHAETGADWILDKMDQIFKSLMGRTWPGEKGLYWDRTDQHIKGLCGFTHGSAGVGFVFAELGRYFQNPALFELARQAFAYETMLYDNDGGWPDLRLGVYSEKDLNEHREHFKSGNLEFFSKTKYMNAWCHGAPGIALSRLRAWEVMKDESCLEQARQALAHLDKLGDKTVSLTLCHGWFGDLNTYLEAYRVLGEEQYLERESVDKCIERAVTDEVLTSGYMMLSDGLECPSLFMGIAGVGYSLLRWRDPSIPSVIAPIQEKMPPQPIDLTRYPNLGQDNSGIFATMIGMYFSRTIRVLRSQNAAALDSFLAQLKPVADFNTEFRNFMDGLVKAEGADPGLVEIFGMENVIYEKDMAVSSHSLIRSRLTFHQEAMAERGREEQVEGDDLLVLDENIALVDNHWNWTPNGPFGAPLEEPYRLLIHPQASEIIETPVNVFTSEILGAFQEKNSVNTALDQILEIFELDDPGEAEQVKALARKQIHEALKAGLLFFAD